MALFSQNRWLKITVRLALFFRASGSLVSEFTDYIEDLIEREIPFNMEQFAASVNEFLEFRKYDILEGNGRISRNKADEKAFSEYEVFNKTQKIDSDFDKMIKKLEKK